RDQAYIGVMIDDLVTGEIAEPYRLFTSRAEYRLLLRQDNADLRLSSIGHGLGLIDDQRWRAVEAKRTAISEELAHLARVYLPAPEKVAALLPGQGVGQGLSALEFLRRPGVDYGDLVALGLGSPSLTGEVREQVEIEDKYEGYIRRQQEAVERVRRLEERAIPPDFDHEAIPGLRNEAREKLKRHQPATLGQASRLSGVTPADLAILIVQLERRRRAAVPFDKPPTVTGGQAPALRPFDRLRTAP
ncbi:MAG: tRNA uridine-5-carboxymethylaminomethyl(34) synthesis enzyme MnmG, partial [Chloroflexota bacterium]|nr:tRNA uridine-5-carboxymethylaminomethyl(34) synthesis enzyme MnmG [Chloroflexota bacterium]